MRHSSHPVLAMLALSLAGGVVGIGLQFFVEPWTSVATIAAGATAGVIVSHLSSANVLLGLALGTGAALLVLGVRALVSIASTLRQPPSARAWFSR